MRREKKKMNKIIIGLVSLLFLMTAGYAAFQTNLTIKGTSKINSNWDIRITNVTEGNKIGNGENVKTPTWTNLTASMEANLYEKGDAVEYEVTIENKGTFDAKLESISTSESSNEAIKISFSGYTKGEKLYKNSTQTIIVKVGYNKNFNGTPSSNTNEVKIDLNYVQAEGGTIEPTNDYLLTYDYRTNGGEGTSETAHLSSNESVDLSKKGNKEGYEFVGWNTDKNAKSGLSMLNMPSEDTILYAIYKKTLTVTYTKGTGVSEIGKTEDKCDIYNNETSCEITLPSITASEGYDEDGWYNGTTKVGTQNTKANIITSTNLKANASPKIYTITYDKNYFENNLWQDTANINRYVVNINESSTKNIIDDNYVRGGKILSFKAAVDTKGSSGPYYDVTRHYNGLEIGKIYTATVYIRIFPYTKPVGIYTEQGNVKTYNITNEWQKIKYTTTVNTNDGQGYSAFVFYTNFMKDEEIQLHSLEIMEGEPTYETATKEYGATLGTLPAETRTGYTFIGWYTKPYGGEKVTSTTQVTKDTILYAQYNVNKYNVSYNSNGGSTVSTVATNYEGPYTLPTPTKSYVVNYNYNGATSGNTTANATSNYTFNGWYKESTLTNQILNTDVLTETNNQTLYAKWNKTSITLPSPTKTGYIFGGWYSDSSFVNKVGDGGASYTPSSNQTLYAKWTEDTVNINVSTSKTTNSITAVATATATSGISKYEFSKDNGTTWIDNKAGNTYTFTGLTHNTAYNIKARVTSKTGKAVTTTAIPTTTNTVSMATFSETGDMSKKVTIVYPSGCGSTYTCSYSKDGGAFVTVTTNPTIDFSVDGTVVAKVSDRTNTVSNSYNVVYPTVTYDLNYLPNDEFYQNYDTKFYGCCQGTITFKKATISDDINGKLITVTGNTTEGIAGWYFIAKVNQPLVIDQVYTFSFEAKGSEAFDATIGSEQNGATSFPIKTEWDRYTHTFTAKTTTISAFRFYYWLTTTDRTLQIRNLQLQKGGLNTSNVKLNASLNLINAIKTPTRTGYRFLGWYTKAVGGTKILETSAFPVSGTTYYAHWSNVT